MRKSNCKSVSNIQKTLNKNKYYYGKIKIDFKALFRHFNCLVV